MRALTSKLPSYLLRLNLTYDRAGKVLERDLIGACRFKVFEDVEYDGWNGGTYGHNVIMYLPLDELTKVGIDEQDEIGKGICGDLNKLSSSVSNEFFNAVHLEMEDENDADFQEAMAFSSRPQINPDNLLIWKPGLARVFISHRDGHKVEARELADELEGYGMSCFVAHETIPANEEWRKVIVNGLETMEAMVCFLTDDFQDSIWTMQEVGYAIGKNVPIISLKLGSKDPPGFISHVQAQRGNIDQPVITARRLFPLLGKALGRKERLQEVLVNSFNESPSYSDAKVRFDRMDENVTALTDVELERIITAFYTNDQLHQAGYLTSRHERLRKFLERTTDRKFTVDGRKISEVKQSVNVSFSDLDDDVPF